MSTQEQMGLSSDEGHSLSFQRRSYRSEAPPNDSIKLFLGKVTDNLDKVLAGVLICLLLLFFLQSSSAGTAKKTITTESLLAPEESSATPSPSPTSTKSQQPSKDKQDGVIAPKETLVTLAHENDSEWEDDELLARPVSNKPKGEKEASQGRKGVEDDSLDSIFDPQAAELMKPTSEDDSNEGPSPSTVLEETKYGPHRHRTAFFQQKSNVANLQYLKLAKFNLLTPDEDEDQRQTLLEQQRRRLQQKYKLSEYPQQLSICVVSHASAHKKPFAHEYLLNSVLSQEYSQFVVVYVADGFTAQEVQAVRQYIKLRDTDKRVSLVWNNEKKFFLESTVTAVKTFCMEKRVTVLIDGEDELMGTQVFKVLNAFYRKHSANVVYGNFVEYHSLQQLLRLGFSTQYDDAEKRDNIYRSVGQKFGNLKSFKTRLISFIKEKDFRDSFGNFYRYAGDYALMYPLLQLACGQVRYMPEFNYLYFGYEIDPTYGSMQIATGRAIRERPRYECFKRYK